ncbi:MAG: hypothetical protein JWN70_1617 [Planctomycetaceae bacterium]|nr:hypothetical protein [Planctomycetaceae bacterium]
MGMPPADSELKLSLGSAGYPLGPSPSHQPSHQKERPSQVRGDLARTREINVNPLLPRLAPKSTPADQVGTADDHSDRST